MRLELLGKSGSPRFLVIGSFPFGLGRTVPGATRGIAMKFLSWMNCVRNVIDVFGPKSILRAGARYMRSDV